MADLEEINIALCQMDVIPGKPDLNTDYIVKEIEEAKKRRVDIIALPELCISGYFLGDEFENRSFVSDIAENHKRILAATKGGITAVFGTVIRDHLKIGENGFFRLFNAGVVYTDGIYVGRVIKTLMPNYRMFDDDRHFYSNRKLAEDLEVTISELLKPIEVKLQNGKTISLGVTLCEDIWDEYYPVSPAGILATNGANVILNLSASPWTWQKNRRRHTIVKDLAKHTGIPLVYVNNVGVQNIGKNIVVFDGCSTIYNESGLPIFEIPAHVSGTSDFKWSSSAPVVPEREKEDDKELFDAACSAVSNFFKNIPPEKRKVVIGLSGGIDSASSTALYVNVLGKESVIGINMPMPASNPILQNAAKELAENLGIKYEVIPISTNVALCADQLGVKAGSLAYENLQARTRMNILATCAQQIGGFFTANFNKVEQAFGYGTLGGDMEGCLAVLGDMVKREVYQLADYMNREVYGRQVIPQASFDEPPTADLKKGQKDPFDYGNVQRRGYHDEMVRAFTEFRRDPEWFIGMYTSGKLEGELKLDSGTIKRLFPTSLSFVKDLEKHWQMFYGSYFKRIQAPPVLIVSRRAFGGDMRESMLPAHFTKRYLELKESLLSDPTDKVVVYGGSFNPPLLHHCQIVKQLTQSFEKTFIVPCGNRVDKPSTSATSTIDRKELAKRAFEKIPNVEVDYGDLDNNRYSPAYLLDQIYKEEYPNKEVWHAIGGDLIEGGKDGKSQIQTRWKNGVEVWNKLNFAVIQRAEINFDPKDLPPNSIVIPSESLFGSSTLARKRISAGEEIEKIFLPKVWEYITKKELYGYQKKDDAL
ncbi:MAG: NAD(+) synthase [Candidatus Vogelbacteria bacterium]|nr:NAD(+) synthase [Candidatus Vogelbacteria bacterium]